MSIEGNTFIGSNTKIFPLLVLELSQDLKFKEKKLPLN